MHREYIQNKKIRKDFLEIFGDINVCEVSKASAEIMLDRFCDGKEIDFPFLNN